MKKNNLALMKTKQFIILYLLGVIIGFGFGLFIGRIKYKPHNNLYWVSIRNEAIKTLSPKSIEFYDKWYHYDSTEVYKESF
jgi:hypothetical protein